MNASKLFAAIAALVFAGSAAAADAPVANAAATSAATAAAAAAAQGVTAAARPANSRDKVRSEAIEAAKNRRASEAGQADWFMK